MGHPLIVQNNKHKSLLVMVGETAMSTRSRVLYAHEGGLPLICTPGPIKGI